MRPVKSVPGRNPYRFRHRQQGLHGKQIKALGSHRAASAKPRRTRTIPLYTGTGFVRRNFPQRPRHRENPGGGPSSATAQRDVLNFSPTQIPTTCSDAAGGGRAAALADGFRQIW